MEKLLMALFDSLLFVCILYSIVLSYPPILLGDPDLNFGQYKLFCPNQRN